MWMLRKKIIYRIMKEITINS